MSTAKSPVRVVPTAPARQPQPPQRADRPTRVLQSPRAPHQLCLQFHRP